MLLLFFEFCNVVTVIHVFFTVGRLSHEVGWQYQEVIEKLNTKRRVKGFAYHKEQKKILNLKAQAIKNVSAKIAPYQKIIESFGYH